ncbi:MAG: ABC transporter ATP-binding protein [Deltaproteobacteria bacterium]|nr:ABC transporter ATP-binding protein [Deltaproteobacteria bacterium]
MLEARDVSLTFRDGGRETHALQSISVTLPAKGVVAIFGPSGSGKSSLLFVLSGLRLPTRGEVTLEGRPFSERPEAERAAIRERRFGFVFQRHYLLEYLTARENARLCASLARSGAADRTDELLRRLGLGDKAGRRPSKLSGGERQRVAVARALAHGPSVVFADEPTASLDAENRAIVMGILSEEAERGPVVVATHDEAIVRDAVMTIRLRDGVVVEG